MTRCPRCGKKPIMATTRKLLRGHYNPTVKSKRYVNLQWARVDGKRMKLCTDCIKTLAKQSAMHA
ncbi:MAG TPA: 50S ribosomal protein L28 [Candidatus Paceibacterota bacterium]|nr:50S ribosomal protein L28 [Candidatus Paceibacterota bacterium]